MATPDLVESVTRSQDFFSWNSHTLNASRNDARQGQRTQVIEKYTVRIFLVGERVRIPDTASSISEQASSVPVYTYIYGIYEAINVNYRIPTLGNLPL